MHLQTSDLLIVSFLPAPHSAECATEYVEKKALHMTEYATEMCRFLMSKTDIQQKEKKRNKAAVLV